MAPAVTHRGIVLRVADVGDYDRMLTLLTPDAGRQSAFCRGCRKPGAKNLAAAQLFVLGDFQLQPRAATPSLLQSQVHESHYALRLDYARLTAASGIAKLALAASLPDAADTPLFELVLEAFDSLCREAAPEVVAAQAALRMLDLQGLAPRLDACCRCGDIPTRGLTFASVEQGGALCGLCAARCTDAIPLTPAQLAALGDTAAPWGRQALPAAFVADFAATHLHLRGPLPTPAAPAPSPAAIPEFM